MDATDDPLEELPDVQRLAGILPYKDDAVVSHVILKRNAGQITLFAFDSGREWSAEALPCEALVTGLEGEADVTLEGTPHRLRAGDMLTLPAGCEPRVRAATRFKMLLVMIRE